MKPEIILKILRKDARNNITVFHRGQTAHGAGGHMVGVTLNYHEPYYEGWAPSMAMQNEFISMSELLQIENHLTVEHWGTPTLGGRTYRLKEAQ